jgi:phosphoribosylanthranilate isomerase
MTKIKVCGNTRRLDVERAIELGVDMLGFIFTRSKRQIDIDRGRELVADLPTSVLRVGVFIDEPPPQIAAAVDACGLNAVQLYRPIGPEDRKLGVRFLPALRVRPGEGMSADGFQPDDHPLLDTWNSESSGGGSGETWEWERAEPLARRYQLIVSGGLRASNVADAIRSLRPWGVDVCSGVEASPGEKDPTKLRDFVAAVRAADQA